MYMRNLKNRLTAKQKILIELSEKFKKELQKAFTEKFGPNAYKLNDFDIEHTFNFDRVYFDEAQLHFIRDFRKGYLNAISIVNNFYG